MYCCKRSICQAPFADQRHLKMAQNHMTIRRKRDHLEMGAPSMDYTFENELRDLKTEQTKQYLRLLPITWKHTQTHTHILTAHTHTHTHHLKMGLFLSAFSLVPSSGYSASAPKHTQFNHSDFIQFLDPPLSPPGPHTSLPHSKFIFAVVWSPGWSTNCIKSVWLNCLTAHTHTHTHTHIWLSQHRKGGSESFQMVVLWMR